MHKHLRTLFLFLYAAVNCGALSDPGNGTVVTPTTTFTQVATYTCNEGYNIVGSMTRTCEADQIWRPAEPTCDRK